MLAHFGGGQHTLSLLPQPRILPFQSDQLVTTQIFNNAKMLLQN